LTAHQQLQQQFHRRLILLQIECPSNPWDDPVWLQKYEDTIDTVYLRWMSLYSDPLQGAETFRSWIRPHLLQPWSTELDTDIHLRHSLTPRGIRTYLKLNK
jgi:hypothetical protein